ncbi:MAG: tetratricopeptide repeat protein [Cyanobacteria bacterium SZAS TMP-1]|nr:tetratricopeptide repeat protein [Cyanobacteria bacterium SZAS TMP-1]
MTVNKSIDALVGSVALGLLTSITVPLCGPAFAQGQNPGPTPTQTHAPSSTFSRPTKEFKFRKRYIAPSADLYNRIDYASMQSRDSLMLPTYEPSYGKRPPGQSDARPPVTYQPIHPDEPAEGLKAQAQSLSNSGIRPMANRDGLKPPAAPSASHLLPSSLTKQNAPATSSLPEHGYAPLSNARIAQIKSQAESLSKQGHLAEAQEVLNRAVQEHPREVVLRSELSKISLERARFFSKQGNAQEAASQARMAIAYGSAYSSASESAYSLLASNLSKAGIDPRNPEARASLGQSLLAENKPLEAEIEYRQAIKLKPTVDSYIGAGSAAMQTGNKTSAKLDFQKALELNPNSEAALSRLGAVRYQLNDFVGANADLTRALVMNSQDTFAAQTLIDLWQRQVAARPEDASTHLGLARAYLVTGDLDSAKKEYKVVVKIDPNHPNLAAARQSYKLALAKREARKSFDLAHSLETQGQLPAAYQKASDAVELYPSDGGYVAYKAQLANQLQAAGMPVFAQSGMAMQALSNLVQGGEQPPAASLPTAQSLGLTGPNMAMPGVPGAPVNPLAGMMATENMYKPVSTDSHVTSMTGFLASIRNFTMQQKAAQDAIESGAGSMGAVGGGASALGAAALGAVAAPAAAGATDVALPGPLSGVPGFAPSNPLPGSGLPSSLDQGQMIAQGAQAQAALAGAAATSAPSNRPVTASSALQAAARALANTGGGALGSAIGGPAGGEMAAAGSGSIGSNFMNGLSSAMRPAGAEAVATKAVGTAAAAATSPGAAPTVASTSVSNNMAAMALGLAPQIVPSMIAGAGKTMSYLHKNSTTQAVGNVVPQAQSGQPAYSYGFTPSGNFATNQTMPTITTQKVITSPGGDIATAQAMTMAPTAEQTNANWPQPQPLNESPAPTAVATLAPPIVPTNPTSMSPYPATADDLHSLIPPGALKLYLTGVNASKSDVQLQVSLRNDSPVPLKIPAGIKAIVRTGGQPDKDAKVNFSSKMVGSGSTISGTIKVPGRSLDPTSDVVIPTGSLTKGALADIHLSVPISAR